MKLKPLGDRLIVRAIESDEEGFGVGVVLPEGAKDQAQKGRVLAVGSGAIDDEGRRVPLEVEAGDEIVYSKYGAMPITVDGEDLLVLRSTDLYGRELVHEGFPPGRNETAEDAVTERLSELRNGVRNNIAHLRELAK